jgi:hypothetical protein
LDNKENNKLLGLDNKYIKIKPKINIGQSSYLKNLNEYEIREGYTPNRERVIEYKTKPKNDYNCVTDKKLNFNPTKITVDKWPNYYEK